MPLPKDPRLAEETKKKMRESALKRTVHGHTGHPHSEESRLKISKACNERNKKGSDHYKWKGGRKHHSGGYVYIYSPNHPYKDIDGYVFEHRLIMEKHIGRYLTPDEVVHHINGIKDDNRIENLMLFPNQAAHAAYHYERSK